MKVASTSGRPVDTPARNHYSLEKRHHALGLLGPELRAAAGAKSIIIQRVVNGHRAFARCPSVILILLGVLFGFLAWSAV